MKVLFNIFKAQWAAPQLTPMCQNFTMELESYLVVEKLKIDQINLAVGLMCCPLYLVTMPWLCLSLLPVHMGLFDLTKHI